MKTRRQAKIIDLILSDVIIETQDELVNILKSLGFDATQATVSRDIRELKLTKTSDGKRFRYISLPLSEVPINKASWHILINGVTCIDYVGNILIVKTLPGMAAAVAKCLDDLDNLRGVVGTVAGDDCLLCVCDSEKKVVALISQLKRILSTYTASFK